MKKAIAIFLLFNVVWLFFIETTLILINKKEETNFIVSISGTLSASIIFALLSSFNMKRALELASLENTQISFFHIVISVFYVAFVLTFFSLKPSENLLSFIEKINFSNLMAVLLLAPVVEELIFRGAIFKSLEKAGYRPSFIIIITSISFCAIHVQHEIIFQLIMFPVLLIIGHSRSITGNVITPCIIHVLLNLTFIVFSMKIAI